MSVDQVASQAAGQVVSERASQLHTSAAGEIAERHVLEDTVLEPLVVDANLMNQPVPVWEIRRCTTNKQSVNRC